MRDILIKLIDQKQVYGIDNEQPRKYGLLLLGNAELADHLLANGVTVNRWISVTKRMPERAGMPVLVVAVNSFGQKRVVQAFTNYDYPVEFETNHKEFDMTWKTAWKVTHWMPLPEPPSDEDAERETSEVYGEWIDSHVPGSALSECSLCHYDCGAWSMKFCPMCGHPMKRNGGTKQSVSEDRE